jgi:hypothetical protein
VATTPKYGLRTPQPTDPGDVPTDMAELAADVEALLSTGTVDLTDGTLKVKTPAGSDQPLRRDAIIYGPVASPPATLADGQVWMGYG